MVRYGLAISRFTLLLSIAIFGACKPAPQQSAAKKPAGPTVRATVVTIRTTMKPEARTQTRSLVIAGGRARDTGERDVWRLFDTKTETVTFVDDIARTFRTESLQTLLAQRRAITANGLPSHYPRVRVERPGTTRAIHGVTAELMKIDGGAYKRELWIGEHPSIPRGLFAMMYASEPPTQPLAPMMRAVDEAFLATRGFPLADHATLPMSNDELIVDRFVVGIAVRDVPQALLAIPKGYHDAAR
ncbi:MAG: DUF4412 domain-containing protein [Acidobacteriota bacterium]|nr:DUF4412 domain-containing protein [Acidobacteriota bacterium]